MAEHCCASRTSARRTATTVKTVALQDVSFSLQGGEFAAIVGQSGSGKSTLLNLIGLLDTPTTGRVLFNGDDASSAGRSRTGGAAQRPDRLRLPVPLPAARVHRARERAHAGTHRRAAAAGAAAPGRRDRSRCSASTASGDKGANDLSGGQKQRVAIARALVNRPSLVLADEPTGNLDTTNSDAVYELFRTVNRELGTAFLIVTHDRGVAQQRRPHPRGERRPARAGRGQRLPGGRRHRGRALGPAEGVRWVHRRRALGPPRPPVRHHPRAPVSPPRGAEVVVS